MEAAFRKIPVPVSKFTIESSARAEILLIAVLKVKSVRFVS